MSFQVHDFLPFSPVPHAHHTAFAPQSPRQAAKRRHMEKNFPLDTVETTVLRLWEGEERLFQLSQKNQFDDQDLTELTRIIRLLQSLAPEPERALDMAQRLFSLLLHQVISMLSRVRRSDPHDFEVERSILWNLRNSLSSFQPLKACG